MRQKSIQLALNLEGAGEAQPDLGRGIEAQTATSSEVSLAHDLMEAVVAHNNEGPWKSAGTPAMTQALTNARLTSMGFHSLHERYGALNTA
jgi:hypothetical protein